MSRGRSRHQSSRRRMYSARQRDLRERRLDAARETGEPLADDLTAIEIEEASDADVAVPMSMPLRRGATAA
ncbi:MAG: hypothetical protein ABI841_05605 [Chloroflexota bacterium]